MAPAAVGSATTRAARSAKAAFIGTSGGKIGAESAAGMPPAARGLSLMGLLVPGRRAIREGFEPGKIVVVVWTGEIGVGGAEAEFQRLDLTDDDHHGHRRCQGADNHAARLGQP